MLDTRIPFSSPVGRINGPYLPVTFINPHTGDRQEASALIDTGADCCVLPREFAELLGHNYEKGFSKQIAGATGSMTVFDHTAILKCDQYTSAECLVSFCQGLRTPLLGVMGFLENFHLNINYPHRYFELSIPTENAGYISSADLGNWPTP